MSVASLDLQSWKEKLLDAHHHFCISILKYWSGNWCGTTQISNFPSGERTIILGRRIQCVYFQAGRPCTGIKISRNLQNSNPFLQFRFKYYYTLLSIPALTFLPFSHHLVPFLRSLCHHCWGGQLFYRYCLKTILPCSLTENHAKCFACTQNFNPENWKNITSLWKQRKAENVTESEIFSELTTRPCCFARSPRWR